VATHVGLGAAVFATYMARINFGVLLALAVFIEFLIDGQWLRRGRVSAAVAERRRGHILSALALGVPLAIWFAYLPKIVKTLATLADFDPVGPDRFSLDGLLFYPRAVLWMAGSWPLLLLWLVALVLTLRVTSLRCDSRLRMVAILIGLQIFFAELAVTKLERLILPLVPSFSVLVGIWAARLCHRLSDWSLPANNRALAFACGTFTLCSIPALILVTGSPPPLSVTTLRGPTQSPLVRYVIQDVRLHGPALIIGSLDDAPTEIDWELVQSGVMGPDGAGSIASDSDIRFLESGASRLPAFVPEVWREQVNHYPGTSDTYTAYLGMPLGAADGLALEPANFETRVHALLAQHPIQRIMLVTHPNGPTVDRQAEAGLALLGYMPMPADASASNTSLVQTFRRQ
jgi:hypothetical protein